MRKNFGAKAFSYPQPVFIIATYNDDGSADAMNAAWGGISDTTELSVCLSEGHKTVKNLLRTGAFTVSMGDAKHVAACDYVGIASGNNTRDKLAKAGFTVSKSESVDAPVINELAVCMDGQELRPRDRPPGGRDRQRQRGRIRHDGRQGRRGQSCPHHL